MPQPPSLDFPEPFEDRNLLSSSPVLSDAIAREGAGSALKRLSGFALMIGSSGTAELSRRANQHAPQLEAFDGAGRPLNSIAYHPAFLDLIERSAAEGLKAPAVVAQPMPTVRQAAYVEHAAQVYVAAGADGGHVRALTMTSAGLSLLSNFDGVTVSRAQARGFDQAKEPVNAKSAAVLSVSFCESRFGDSLTLDGDGRRAHVSGLIRSVWMPDADAIIALAKSGQSVVPVYVPRFRDDGTVNAFGIRPLNAPAGLRSLALADVCCNGAAATLLVSSDGLVSAVLHQRLHGATALTGLLHRALAEAIALEPARSDRNLGYRTLSQHTLAGIALDVEAAIALTFRLARAFDRASDTRASAWRRLMTPVTCYVVSKLAAAALAEIADIASALSRPDATPLARLVRDGQANLWFDHNSTDMTLDVLHVLQRDADVMDTVLADLRDASAGDDLLKLLYQRVETLLHEPRYLDGRGRMLVEDLGLLAAATLLKAHAPAIVFSGFLNSRLAASGRHFYGQGLDWADHDAILSRITTATT